MISYQDHHTFGAHSRPQAAALVSCVVATTVFGGATSYLTLLRDTVRHFVALAGLVALPPELALGALVVVVVLPLCLLSNLSALRFASYAGFGFSLFLMCVVLSDALTDWGSLESAFQATRTQPLLRRPQCVESFAAAGSASWGGSASELALAKARAASPMRYFDVPGWLQELAATGSSMAVFFFAFVLHLNVVPLYVESAALDRDMRTHAQPELDDDAAPAATGEARTDAGGHAGKPAQQQPARLRRMKRVVRCAVLCATCCYSLMGTIGVLRYGVDVDSNLLNSLGGLWVRPHIHSLL